MNSNNCVICRWFNTRFSTNRWRNTVESWPSSSALPQLRYEQLSAPTFHGTMISTHLARIMTYRHWVIIPQMVASHHWLLIQAHPLNVWTSGSSRTERFTTPKHIISRVNLTYLKTVKAQAHLSLFSGWIFKQWIDNTEQTGALLHYRMWHNNRLISVILFL